MKIALGCDHGGLEHKNAIGEFLKEAGFEVVDFGIYEQVSVDYPDIAKKVCESIIKGDCVTNVTCLIYLLQFARLLNDSKVNNCLNQFQ